METEKKNNFVAILSKLIILALVVIAFGFLFFRTDGFTTTKSFYLKCDENKFISNANDFDILLNKEYKFEIVSEKDKILHKDSKYFVSVIPNITQSSTFSFKVDGENVKFDEVKSLSKGFIIKAYEDYFTLKAFEDLPDILKSIYPGKEVSDCPSTLDSGIPYFKLVVSNENNESVCVNFNLKHNVVIVNLIDNSDETVGKNHIRFSANQFVLTSENQIATFDVEIDDGYFYEFENTDSDILRVKQENNNFTLTLKNDVPIKRETYVDIKFVAKIPSITFTPKSIGGKVGLITYPANKLTFSITELVLTNSNRTATFDCILADDYGIQDYYKGFDGVFETSLWGNRCTVTLAEDYQLKSCTNEEIMFTVIRSAKKVDLNIGCINASGIVGNHISFTDIKNLALDNENRQCTFSFQVDAGYKIEKIEYDATIMNLELSDGQCTVKLIDGYIPVSAVESHIIFNIDFDESITLTINLADETPDMYGKGHIRFPFENICLKNKNRTISFNVEIDDGYAFTYQSNGNGIFKISTNEDGLLTVSLVENYVLTTNSTGKISFVTNTPSLVLSPVDHKDEGHITFSVEDIILTNTQRSATFDFTIEEGYILDDYSFLSDGLFTMTISGNTCTVTLLDDVNLTEIGQYNLLFTVGANE